MKRLILVLAMVIFLLYCSLCGTAQALDLTISYGEDTWVDSWCFEGAKTHALELEVKTPCNKWLDIGAAAQTVWSETSTHLGGTDPSLILAGRLIAQKMLSERVFVEGFGGFGLLLLNNQPGLGRRHLVGNFGVSIGYQFDRWCILYKVDHISIPFCKDKGHNRNYIGIRIPFGE